LAGWAAAPSHTHAIWSKLRCFICTAGCLWTWPGSHKPGVHRRFKRKQDDSVWFDGEQSQYDLEKFVPLEVHPPSLRRCQYNHVHVTSLSASDRIGSVCLIQGWCASQVQVKAGTLVLLHGANVHFSHENTSPHSRHAYRCGPGLCFANMIRVLPSTLEDVICCSCTAVCMWWTAGRQPSGHQRTGALMLFKGCRACSVVNVKSILSTTPCFPLVQAAAFP
jgi:Phytanoyl-CoA dioxygenase (PhyH)